MQKMKDTENKKLFEEEDDSADFLEIEADEEEIDSEVKKIESKFRFEVNGKILNEKEYDDYIKHMVSDYHSGDEYKKELAANEIIRSLDGLIGSIINNHLISKDSQYYEDFFQEGRLAILKYLDNYDPEKSRLSTYFYNRILQAVHKYFSKFVNETSIHTQKNIKIVKDKIAEFEQRRLTNPDFSFTDAMIAEEVGLTRTQVKNVRNIIHRQDKIMYQEYDDKDNSGYRKKIKLMEDDKLLEDDILAKERILTIRKAINQLNQEEQKVILYTFGFLDNHAFSKDEIAQEMGISKDMVIRIINRAKDKLRKSLSSTEIYNEYDQFIEKIIGDPLPLVPYDLANEMMDDIINSEILLNL